MNVMINVKKTVATRLLSVIIIFSASDRANANGKQVKEVFTKGLVVVKTVRDVADVIKKSGLTGSGGDEQAAQQPEFKKKAPTPSLNVVGDELAFSVRPEETTHLGHIRSTRMFELHMPRLNARKAYTFMLSGNPMLKNKQITMLLIAFDLDNVRAGTLPRAVFRELLEIKRKNPDATSVVKAYRNIADPRAVTGKRLFEDRSDIIITDNSGLGQSIDATLEPHGLLAIYRGKVKSREGEPVLLGMPEPYMIDLASFD
jgi:hypothetical protein